LEAVNWPTRFQLKSDTDTCRTVSPLTYPMEMRPAMEARTKSPFRN